MTTLTRRPLAVATAVAAVAALAACSSGSSDSSSSSAAAVRPAVITTGPSGLVGPGCGAYTAQFPSGSGSIENMSQDPLATAASHNPMLTVLTAAISGKLNPKVKLISTLNGGAFTVFAPVDTAFKKMPAKTIDSLKTNTKALNNLLTYHVVAGELPPSKVVGEQTSVEGAKINVTGSGNTIKVNGANVICGGVKTANATVYLIDGVLNPPQAAKK